MKRTLSLLLALTLVVGAAPFAAGEGVREFTDSTGRTLTLPERIDRVAVTGVLAQIAVLALAPDALVGISVAWDESAEGYLAREYYELPVLGQVYGAKGAINLEALLAAAPQVVVDVGDSKDSVAEDMDALAAQTGIPFAHIDATLSTFDTTYAMLGELLGKPVEARALADYCADTYRRVTDIARGVEKVDLLYVLGAEGLNVIARGSYHSAAIDMLCQNLAVVDNPSSRGTGNETDMEQMMRWNPDVILFDPGSVYATAGDDPLWQSVAAVESGRYYEVPFGPYNWMGFPPSAQQLLGMLWMAKLLYPEAADYDLYDEAARFYRMFYHCELSREQYDRLVEKSVGKF